MTSTLKTDSDVQKDVLRELAWDTRIAPSDVGVEVHDGIVTLTGTVSSWAKKVAAEQAAHRVAGVLDVANDMTVKISETLVNDTDIASAVRHALQWDVFVPEDCITSTVMQGVVTLHGTVETLAQREDAERAVQNLAGVRMVFNQIGVQRTDATPEKLRESIHEALQRHADRETKHVQIDVQGGRVILHGSVQSWREREAVVGAVTGTRGVETVVDRLRLG